MRRSAVSTVLLAAGLVASGASCAAVWGFDDLSGPAGEGPLDGAAPGTDAPSLADGAHPAGDAASSADGGGAPPGSDGAAPADGARADSSSSDSASADSASADALPVIAPAIILFGGADPSNNSLDDTWSWDGSTWTPLSVSSPFLRTGACTAPLAGEIVLYGGWNASGTYELDTDWTLATTSGDPGYRYEFAMAPLGSGVVLFGGYDGATTYYDDAWTFDGATWTRASASGATTRSSHAMAELGSNKVVVYGGYGGLLGDAGYGILDDTWTFDGSSWAFVTDVGPGARLYHAMASWNGKVVLFGGASDVNGNDLLGDTWIFDGGSWSEVTTSAQAPSARSSAAMATLDGKLYLFGGQTASGRAADTWSFDGTSWLPVTVSGQSPSPRAGASMSTR
jgi:hypothetical protein